MRRELAFPMCNELGEIYQEGMELRDYFASKALVGILSNQQLTETYDSGDKVAEKAYMIAKKMMDERDKLFIKEANEEKTL